MYNFLELKACIEGLRFTPLIFSVNWTSCMLMELQLFSEKFEILQVSYAGADYELGPLRLIQLSNKEFNKLDQHSSVRLVLT